MFLSNPMSRADEIQVKVVDQADMSGVPSRVLISSNGEQDAENGDYTDDGGELAFNRACSPGEQLLAVPLSHDYHRSGEEPCGATVLLRVKRREAPEDELVDRSRSMILVEYGDGTSREYVVEYDGIINQREVNLGGMTGGFCYNKYLFKLIRDVYLVGEDGAWLKDDSQSSSETLVKDRTKTSPSGSCSKPDHPIHGKVEEQGKQRLRSTLDKDLQALLTRLRKKEGVAAVELQ